ncbi:NAD-dependent epimerase/dehydratase family protein [Agromyces bauzanensis]|nr:NAD-dependent epimerase/dehydratase family protein [Agromyces bauzanensis]
MSKGPILVTGVTGFVGGYVALDLLDQGYDVRGTVRNPDRADVAHLRSAADKAGTRLELVAASLLDDDGWDAAVDGVTAVEHVASPAPKYRPMDEEEVIRPAVDGTRRVLQAAARAGVKRIALTSSVDAIRAGHNLSDGRELSEDVWSVVERAEPYAKSKTIAERAAWADAASLGIDLTVLNPSLILGPVQTATTNVSVDIIRQLLTGELSGLPRLGFAPVDVRDVATAHRVVLERPEAIGRRYVLSTEAIWLADIARVLAEEYNPKGYSVPTRAIPGWIVRLGARFDPTLRLALPLLNQPARNSSARARTELGWTTRETRTTILETAESLVAAGIVKPVATFIPSVPG